MQVSLPPWNLTSPSPRNTPSYSSLTRCFFSFYQHSEEKLTEQVPKLPFTSLYVQPIRWTFMTGANCAGRKATKGHQAGFEAEKQEGDLLQAREAWEGQAVLPISGISIPRISGIHQPISGREMPQGSLVTETGTLRPTPRQPPCPGMPLVEALSGSLLSPKQP